MKWHKSGQLDITWNKTTENTDVSKQHVQLQQRHLNQQRVSVDVVVEEEERIQEEQLHNVLSVIRNRNFKDVHIRSHSEVNTFLLIM